MQPVFLNSQEVVVDVKQRVAIPERFMRVLKKLCPEDADKVGVCATPDRSIKVMPYPYFMRELESWRQLDDRSSDQRLMLNMASSFADQLPFDKQNRIRLSAALCDFCNIKRSVVVVGSIQYMQIFDLDRWKEVVREGLNHYDVAADSVAEKKPNSRPSAETENGKD